MRTVTLAELAEEAGAPVALIERLVAIGQVKAHPVGLWLATPADPLAG